MKIVMSQIVLAVLWKAELYVVYSMPYGSDQCCFNIWIRLGWEDTCIFAILCQFYEMGVSVY